MADEDIDGMLGLSRDPAAQKMAEAAFQALVDGLTDEGVPESRAIAAVMSRISEMATNVLDDEWAFLPYAICGAAYLIMRLPAIDENAMLAAQVRNAASELLTMNLTRGEDKEGRENS